MAPVGITDCARAVGMSKLIVLVCFTALASLYCVTAAKDVTKLQIGVKVKARHCTATSTRSPLTTMSLCSTSLVNASRKPRQEIPWLYITA